METQQLETVDTVVTTQTPQQTENIVIENDNIIVDENPEDFLYKEFSKRERGEESILDKIGKQNTSPIQNEPTETNTALENNNEEIEIPISTTTKEKEENVEPQFDLNKILEEKTNGKFKSIDEVLKLSETKNNIEFVNENSKKLFEAILNGNEEVAYDYLYKKQFVKYLKEQPSEVVVKSYIKEQYPDFTQTEIDRYFEKNFSVNEDAFDDELDLSIAKKQANANLNRTKNEAISYFEKEYGNVSLPEYKTNEAEIDINQILETEPAKIVSAEVKNMIDKDPAFNSYTEIPIKYLNENNGANIQAKIKLDEKDLSQLEYKLGDYPEVVFASMYLKDGEFDKKTFIRDVYISRNVTELLKAATAEGYNQGLLSKLRKDKNIKIDAPITGDIPQIDNEMVQKAKFMMWEGGYTKEQILKSTGVDIDTL